MKIVEVGDTLGWHSVLAGSEVKLGHQLSSCSGHGGDHDRADSVGDRIACQYKDRTIPAWCGGEPDLTALHRPNQTNLLPGPTRQSR